MTTFTNRALYSRLTSIVAEAKTHADQHSDKCRDDECFNAIAIIREADHFLDAATVTPDGVTSTTDEDGAFALFGVVGGALREAVENMTDCSCAIPLCSHFDITSSTLVAFATARALVVQADTSRPLC